MFRSSLPNLNSTLNKRIKVSLKSETEVIGILKGFDAHMNLVLFSNEKMDDDHDITNDNHDITIDDHDITIDDHDITNDNHADYYEDKINEDKINEENDNEDNSSNDIKDNQNKNFENNQSDDSNENNNENNNNNNFKIPFYYKNYIIIRGDSITNILVFKD
ncbi:hypothetical protein DMUE_5955 [Dictyocoela muelleri]|nr:hypothetical protein DMUE_5955 [Dictyocoela muelleri]